MEYLEKENFWFLLPGTKVILSECSTQTVHFFASEHFHFMGVKFSIALDCFFQTGEDTLLSNEWGRLASGNNYGNSFTENFEFICKNDVWPNLDDLSCAIIDLSKRNLAESGLCPAVTNHYMAMMKHPQ